MLDFAGRVLTTLALFCLGYVAIEGTTAVVVAAVAAVLLIFAAMLVAIRKMRVAERLTDIQLVLAKAVCQVDPHEPYSDAERAIISDACRTLARHWDKTWPLPPTVSGDGHAPKKAEAECRQ